MTSPRDNTPSDIPEFGHIVLDSHLLTLKKMSGFLCVAVEETCLSWDRALAVFRLSVFWRWVGMWARPGTLKALCKNNSAADPEPSVLWSKLRFATQAMIDSNLSPACEIANFTFLTEISASPFPSGL